MKHVHDGPNLCPKCSKRLLLEFLMDFQTPVTVVSRDVIKDQIFIGDTILIARKIENVRIEHGTCRIFSSNCRDVVVTHGQNHYVIFKPVQGKLNPGVFIPDKISAIYDVMFDCDHDITMSLGKNPSQTHDCDKWIEIIEQHIHELPIKKTIDELLAAKTSSIKKIIGEFKKTHM